MKQFLTALFFTVLLTNTQAQVSIADQAAIPDANTMLDIKSSSRGVKFPRMTTAQRRAINVSAADVGLMVFDEELNALYMYDGKAWIPFAYAKSQNPLINMDPGNGISSVAELGSSCDISGNFAVVGAKQDTSAGVAYAGAAYVFELVNGKWLSRAKLVALDGNYAGFFGTSVAIDGDYIVVGAPNGKVGNTTQGAAYIFVRNGLNWTQQAKIYANNAAGSFPMFGEAVDISGTSVIVGAPGQKIGVNSQQGSAYVFTRSGVVWNFIKEIQRAGGAALDYFGQSVAMQGDVMVIGAPYADINTQTGAGCAAVYLRSGNTFTLANELTLPSPQANYNAGWSVAMDGDLIALGVPNAVSTNVNTGWAAIFKKQNSIWTFRYAVSPLSSSAIKFGQSVALVNNTLLVGAPNQELDGFTQRGAVYVYNCGSSNGFLTQRITDVNGMLKDQFGTCVATDGVNTVIGAPGAHKLTNVNIGKGEVYFGRLGN